MHAKYESKSSSEVAWSPPSRPDLWRRPVGRRTIKLATKYDSGCLPTAYLRIWIWNMKANGGYKSEQNGCESECCKLNLNIAKPSSSISMRIWLLSQSNQLAKVRCRQKHQVRSKAPSNENTRTNKQSRCVAAATCPSGPIRTHRH